MRVLIRQMGCTSSSLLPLWDTAKCPRNICNMFVLKMSQEPAIAKRGEINPRSMFFFFSKVLILIRQGSFFKIWIPLSAAETSAATLLGFLSTRNQSYFLKRNSFVPHIFKEITFPKKDTLSSFCLMTS